MQSVGLFFGSFNPIHIGHLALANYMHEFEGLSEIWFVVSPLNPFKKADDLLDSEQRIEMVRLATEEQKTYRAEDIELSLPIPSYTIDTLNALTKRYPEKKFSIIMGADNIIRFNKWKSAEEIISNYNILIYPRPGYHLDAKQLPNNCKLSNAPLVEIASSDIRQWIKEGKSTPYLVPERVFEYIKEHKLYI
ncbi:nicotinate (nicotinamide) nucleotide adenylyltransferase [Carboxylicivirga marina]|uniref:Probable nicotinate-nucleotide adenylyltransferase n=1 Tax=Carboxylicivirga marina TaxID=2800988 RepID=A0ABS1HKX8_9BACT|nr:nicotinate (nicotinamide) nucleotide adenylyltransferase [Carboxylicivirga marina]MBK3518327.1 nicotinate-nucleotide adenylyltransferase [Carboxylicivirga marina]